MKMAFPIGFKSNPSDEVSGSRSLADDIYGSKEPWLVFKDCEEKARTQRIYRHKTSIYGVQKGTGVNKRDFRNQIKKGHLNENSMNSSDFLFNEIILPEEYQDCVLKKKNGSRAVKDDRGGEPMMEYSVCGLPIELYSVCGLPIELPAEEWLLEQNCDDYTLCVPDEDMKMECSTCGDLPIDSPAAADSCSSLQEVDGITVEWLLEQIVGLAEDDRSNNVQLEKSSNMPNLIFIDDDDDDDDECSNLAAAAPIDVGLEGKKGDTNLIVIDDDEDDECSILAAETRTDLSLEGKKGDTNLIVIDDDDDECPMIIAAAAAPIDLSLEGKTFTEDFNLCFGLEDNAAQNDHFAWDVDDLFGDYQFPWSGFCGEPDQPSIFL